MYNHNKAQQSKNRVHISRDKLYFLRCDGTDHVIMFGAPIPCIRLPAYSALSKYRFDNFTKDAP